MNKPFQVGITGGIGSGKTTVCKVFQTLGIPIYDADSHAKELMTTDGILVSSIKKEFGDLSYNSDGSLNRAFLAENVFHDQAKLDKLNALVHPSVKNDYKKWVTRHDSSPYVIKEAALLFEAKSNVGLDSVIVVSAPENVRIKRVMSRDAHRTVEQIKGIVEKQMPEDEKLERADYIIVNDDSQLVIPQVMQLHETFLTLSKR